MFGINFDMDMVKKYGPPILIIVGFLAYFNGWLPMDKVQIGSIEQGALQCPTNTAYCEAQLSKDTVGIVYSACDQVTCLNRLAECRDKCNIKPGNWVQSVLPLTLSRLDYAQTTTFLFYGLLLITGAYVLMIVLPWFRTHGINEFDPVVAEKIAKQTMKDIYKVPEGSLHVLDISAMDGMKSGAEKYQRYAIKSGKPWVAIAKWGEDRMVRIVGDVQLRKATHIDIIATGDWERSTVDDYTQSTRTIYSKRLKPKKYTSDIRVKTSGVDLATN